jgi:hypothetical protein
MAALGTLARPDVASVDDSESDADQQRIGTQPSARERLSQSWQGATQGTGPQAEAVSRRAQLYAKRRAERQARRGQPPAATQLEAEASAFARQGYARIWDGVQEAVADLNLAWFGVLSLALFPVQAAIFFARLLSNVFGEIRWREVTVPRVPPYDWTSGMLHSLRLMVNALIFLIWAALIGGALFLLEKLINPLG